MSDTETKLIHAAIETFMRYGFRRTTMGDIATSAGLSRQTLYTSYANKEEILAAAIAMQGQQTLVELEEDWQSAQSVADILSGYCELVIIKQFEMIRKMPDAEDLISGLCGSSKTALLKVQELHAKALAEKLLAISGIDEKYAQTQAGFFVLAAKGLKHVAEDTEILRDQLTILVSATSLQIETG